MSKCLFIWLLIWGFSPHLFAENSENKEVLLRQLASSAQDTGRLSTLYQLILITDQTPQEQVVYIDRLLKESDKQDNNLYKCRAYWHHIIQAYNKYDSEGVNKWVKLLEPLARKEKLHDLLFRGRQSVIDMLLVTEEYELEEKEAKLMLKDAQALNHAMGQVGAYQSLAYVYQITYREKEAFDVLQKAIELGPKCSNQLVFGEVLRTMMATCENLKDYHHWLKYLKMQDSLIGCFEKQFPDESFSNFRMLNAISYLRYHLQLKEWDKAKDLLQQVELFYSDEYSMIYKYNYFTAKSYYYISTKDWNNALQAMDEIQKLLESTNSAEYAYRLVLKAKLLNQLMRNQEALAIYKQAKQVKDTLSVRIIQKQTEQLKKSYQSDLQVLSQAEQQQRIQQIFLILSGIIILTLALSILHAYHIKRKLIKDEKIMQAMMDETEQANKIKERFLSNINMTIRPPLEIIVNNSARLASEEQFDQTEKNQLSTLITQTSNDLMVLINDILILSRLEAGMMKFSLKEIEIVQFVGNIAEVINHSGAENVSMDVSGQTEYTINGDENYLKQVINSICDADGTTAKAIHIQFEKNEESGIHIKFTNSALASEQASQELVIRNEINRMIIEGFGGKYSINTSSSTPCIILSFTQIEK